MLDMNGQDIAAVDEVKALILESVNLMRGRITRRGCREWAVKGPVRPEASRDEECLLSTLGT